MRDVRRDVIQPAAGSSPSDAESAEAHGILQNAVAQLADPNCDIVSTTMQVRHAYELLRFHDLADLLTLELAGRPPGEVPYWRRVPCRYVWSTDHTHSLARNAVRPDPRLADRGDELRLYDPMPGLVRCRAAGIRYPTGRSQHIAFTSLGVAEQISWSEYVVVEPFAIDVAIERWRNELHLGVGRRLIALRASEEAASLWNLLHTDATALAGRAGIGDDLQSIERAARGNDPSAWEGALLRCRNLVDKLSSYLWQAPGTTYPHILDRGSRSLMAVDGDHYRNRLVAYLHQKGLNASSRDLAESHLDWFKGFVDQVNKLGSKGKHDVGQRDVANGLMHSYLLLSELAARTDGQPVRHVK